jgi:hypothetical protein
MTLQQQELTWSNYKTMSTRGTRRDQLQVRNEQVPDQCGNISFCNLPPPSSKSEDFVNCKGFQIATVSGPSRVYINQGCKLFPKLLLGSAWLSGSWPPLPFIPTSLPLRVSSLQIFPYLLLLTFPLHFWISAAQSLTLDLLRNSSSFHSSSFHPSSLLLFHTPCCTQGHLIYSSHFILLSFIPLVVISANGVVFFFLKLYWFKYLLHFCLMLVVVSTPLLLLMYSWGFLRTLLRDKVLLLFLEFGADAK